MLGDAVTINIILNLVFLMIILYLDRYEKEPLLPIAAIFFVSIILTYAFGITKGLLIGNRQFSALVTSYIEAGFFEELIKFGLLAFVVFRIKDLDEPFDLVLYMAIIALGFTLVENIGYYLKFTQKGYTWYMMTRDSSLYNRQLLAIFSMRMVPIHLLVDVTAVWFIGRSRGSFRRLLPMLLAFLTAVALHGTWNYLTFIQADLFLTFLFLLPTLAVLSIVSLTGKSRYRFLQHRLEQKIDNNLFMLENCFYKKAAASLQPILHQLKEIRSLLPLIVYLTGREQEAFGHFFNSLFPQPINQFIKQHRSRSQENLSQILERMRRFKDRQFDWSYYAAVVVALAVTALVAVMLIVLVEAIFQKS